MHPAIDSKRLVDLFCRLVSIDSPSRGEREVCDHVKGLLTALGLDPQEDGAAEPLGGNCGNLYCYVDGSLDLPPLLFSAHLDTVEPSRDKRAVVDGAGRITSAGDTVLGADDVSAMAAILEALTALKESGTPHRPLELVFSAAEEPYCVGIQQFDFSRLRSRDAYVFDLTGPVGGAANAAPAIISFTVEFRGRAAHAGFSPEEGVHAIAAAGRAIAGVQCGRVGGATVNIGSISGGTANNIVPDRCTLTGEIRSLSNEEAKLRLEELTAVMERAAREMGAEAGVRHVVECSAYRTAPDAPVVRRFERACGELGLESGLCDTFGGSDNNHFARHGISGIVAATAMNSCHSCQEYTTVQELERAASLALHLMLSRD